MLLPVTSWLKATISTLSHTNLKATHYSLWPIEMTYFSFLVYSDLWHTKYSKQFWLKLVHKIYRVNSSYHSTMEAWKDVIVSLWDFTDRQTNLGPTDFSYYLFLVGKKRSPSAIRPYNWEECVSMLYVFIILDTNNNSHLAPHIFCHNHLSKVKDRS